MDIDLFKSNLTNIINRGKYANRTVDVAVLKTSLNLVSQLEAENRRLKQTLAAIEAISSGIETRAA